MKKKTLGRITALGIAAVTAVPTFSIVASADFYLSDAWKVQTGVSATGVPEYDYYTTKPANVTWTDNAGVVHTSTPERVYSIPNISSGSTIYYDANGKIYKDSVAGGTPVVWKGGSSSSSADTSTPYYKYNYASNTSFLAGGIYYPNLQAVYAALGYNTAYTTKIPEHAYNASTGYIYFDPTSGNYTNVAIPGITITIVGTTSNYYYNQYVIPSGYAYASNTSYYSPETKTYYPNLEALRAAVGYNTNNYTTKTPASGNHYSSTNHYFDPTNGNYYSTSGGNRVSVTAGTATNYYRYYSTVTGMYYDTYAAALNASGGDASKVVYGYGYNGVYDYTDPYYYYYYYYGLGGYGYTTTKDTSKVTIGKSKGWTNVIKTINSAKAGASYTVNMNTETEITESVLKALKGKNVTINFKYSNGAVISINGTDITSTSAISPTIRYGSTSIPSTLKKKAVKANDGVSSSQFTINGGSFGATASVTVKFNSKRSGCSAKLYRYNSSDNTLSLVSRSAVQRNGQCEFDNVKQGGEYIVVLS